MYGDRIAKLIDEISDLVHIVRPDGSFEFVNQAWLNTLGYTREEVPNLKLDDIIHPSSIKHYQDLLSIAMKGERQESIEAMFVTKNGETVYVEGIVFPFIEDEKIVGAYGFYRNITEKKNAEKQLIETQRKVEFFIDLITHDLTNINQEILSIFELIYHSPDISEEMKKLLDEGIRELDRSSQLIANVKKLHLIETEKPVVGVRDLGASLKRAAEEVAKAFPDKKLVLRSNFEPGQFKVMADDFLVDVFYALIHNAMKFDPKNEVIVEVEAEEIRYTPFVKIQVKDHGPGIRDEQKEEIFDKIIERRETILGLGLGLTLVKKIIENYGGQIYIEDRVEGDYSKGANFVLLIRKAENQKTEDENN